MIRGGLYKLRIFYIIQFCIKRTTVKLPTEIEEFEGLHRVFEFPTFSSSPFMALQLKSSEITFTPHQGYWMQIILET